MKIEKIHINKNDEASAVIERVIAAIEVVVVLVIPKFSRFIETESNFHLLKRESESAGKEVRIESVDDRAVELGNANGFRSSNPFFAKPERQFADIVVAKKQPVVQLHEEKKETKEQKKIIALEEEIKAEFGPEEPRHRRQLPKARTMVTIVALLMISGGLSFVGLKVLPRAEVQVTARRQEFTYSNSVIVDKSLRAIDVSGARVPGQVFIEKKNTTVSIEATGKKYISEKARGKLTIYNSYSSDAQKLVASTRFMTLDGKIVRLVNAVVVPGAKINDGKIIPSNIEVDVIADKPGAEFSVPAAAHLTIPGLKGTPKYNAFYGELKAAMVGGYVGERAYPTDEDIKKAKATAAETINESLKLALKEKIPNEFTGIDGGLKFSITKQVVNPETNEARQFSVFVEGELRIIAFRANDMLALMQERMKQQFGNEYVIEHNSISYGAAHWDGEGVKVTVPLNYKGVAAYQVNADSLRGRVLQKSEKELKALLIALPGLESAKVKLWPFWVRSVPESLDKVKISVE